MALQSISSPVSCGLQQIPYCPKIPFNARCHRRSSAKRDVTFHKIVIGKMQGNRCLEVLFLLAESVGQVLPSRNGAMFVLLMVINVPQ
jgi:hypothetical protein